MYLIIDKKTHSILHMSNSFPGEDKKPEDLFPSFDPATMDFGRSPEQYIPVHFAIEDGVVKDRAPPIPAAPEGIAQARERVLREFSDLAIASRRQLIPDHQLLNAGIGVYEDDRVAMIRATVKCFRDEYYRLEKLVAKSKSVKELAAIKPAFPMAQAAPRPEADPKTK